MVNQNNNLVHSGSKNRELLCRNKMFKNRVIIQSGDFSLIRFQNCSFLKGIEISDLHAELIEFLNCQIQCDCIDVKESSADFFAIDIRNCKLFDSLLILDCEFSGGLRTEFTVIRGDLVLCRLKFKLQRSPINSSALVKSRSNREGIDGIHLHTVSVEGNIHLVNIGTHFLRILFLNVRVNFNLSIVGLNFGNSPASAVRIIKLFLGNRLEIGPSDGIFSYRPKLSPKNLETWSLNRIGGLFELINSEIRGGIRIVDSEIFNDLGCFSSFDTPNVKELRKISRPQSLRLSLCKIYGGLKISNCSLRGGFEFKDSSLVGDLNIEATSIFAPNGLAISILGADISGTVSLGGRGISSKLAEIVPSVELLSQSNILKDKDFSLVKTGKNKNILLMSGDLIMIGSIRIHSIYIKENLYIDQTVILPSKFLEFSELYIEYVVDGKYRVMATDLIFLNSALSQHILESDHLQFLNNASYCLKKMIKGDDLVSIYNCNIDKSLVPFKLTRMKKALEFLRSNHTHAQFSEISNNYEYSKILQMENYIFEYLNIQCGEIDLQKDSISPDPQIKLVVSALFAKFRVILGRESNDEVIEKNIEQHNFPYLTKTNSFLFNPNFLISESDDFPAIGVLYAIEHYLISEGAFKRAERFTAAIKKILEWQSIIQKTEAYTGIPKSNDSAYKRKIYRMGPKRTDYIKELKAKTMLPYSKMPILRRVWFFIQSIVYFNVKRIFLFWSSVQRIMIFGAAPIFGVGIVFNILRFRKFCSNGPEGMGFFEIIFTSAGMSVKSMFPIINDALPISQIKLRCDNVYEKWTALANIISTGQSISLVVVTIIGVMVIRRALRQRS